MLILAAGPGPAAAADVPTPSPVSQTAAAAPSSASAGSPTETQPYQLAPGDRIEMKMFQQPDMTTNDRLGADGQITLPLIGRVRLAGMTEEQAKAHVTRLYEKDYFVHPQVTLSVTERGKWKFTVSGQVARPGTYEASNGEKIDLVEAISRAGDFNGKSKKTDVQVIRKDQPPISKNVEDLMRGKEPPFEILPGDQIIVKERII
jgi:polysaccharide export outer membrane protein